ncbi:MAG: hypothetical protein LUC38_09245 [Oscillospiraceae bacterium]|nr:hypothetical protein [Oscillospiraceae bacterium]
MNNNEKRKDTVSNKNNCINESDSKTTIPTFGELLDTVKSTTHIRKLPRAGRIRKSDAEVLLTEQIFGATVAVFENGFIIYSRNEHETVTAVDRCASPVYAFSASTEEVKKGFGVAGCECRFIRKKHGAILLSTVPRETFLQYPWYVPIIITCEARLDNNQESRERYRIKFHFSDDNYAGGFNSSSESMADLLLYDNNQWCKYG